MVIILLSTDSMSYMFKKSKFSLDRKANLSYRTEHCRCQVFVITYSDLKVSYALLKVTDKYYGSLCASTEMGVIRSV